MENITKWNNHRTITMIVFVFVFVCRFSVLITNCNNAETNKIRFETGTNGDFERIYNTQ